MAWRTLASHLRWSAKPTAREDAAREILAICLRWSEQIEWLGGPAQPPPTHRAWDQFFDPYSSETQRNHLSLDSIGDPR